MYKSFNLILLFLVLIFMIGCAPTYYYTYKSSSTEDYVPPEPKEIKSSRIYNFSYDEVWEGIISFFATTNISIKTLEKDSGIVVAEKSLDDSKEMKDFVDIGYIDETNYQYRIKNEQYYGYLNPYDFYSLSLMTRPAGSELISKNTVKKDLDVSVLSVYNVFARKIKEGTEVSVNINYKILPDSKNYKAFTTGLFEELALDYIDNFLRGKQNTKSEKMSFFDKLFNNK